MSNNAVNNPFVPSAGNVNNESEKIGLFGRKQEIQRLRSENQTLKADNAQLQNFCYQTGSMDMLQQQQYFQPLENQIAERGTSLNQLDSEIADRRDEINRLKVEVIDLRETPELQEQGFYDFKNPVEDSVELSITLEQIRSDEKQMVRDKTAINHTDNFLFNNSKSKGKKFINDMSRMALSLYNAEAENCIKSVRAGNLQSSVARLNRCAERIERFGTFIDLQVNHQYQQLRINELEVTARFMMAKEAEKEAERERKAELREQRKAEKELEEEMARLRKEQEHYENVLDKMRDSGDPDMVSKLELKLNDIKKSIKDVDYRAANIRAGYVYVISDIGAFGERMVKIGMTRRLEPLDRIRELSDASVPFKFDVHALFFSKDAVSLETMLHHEFEDRRVNKVNARKEYYYCTPEEVLNKLKERNVAVVEYKLEPDAEEYRISKTLAEKKAVVNENQLGRQAPQHISQVQMAVQSTNLNPENL